MTAPSSHRESDGTYHGVVAVLNDNWRVIVCRDGIQWILQKAEKTSNGAAWRGRSFCRTRLALIRVCGEHAGEIQPAAAAILAALPERLS